MGLTDLTISAFLAEIEANSPAPGGGSASALVGAIAACLAKMVGALTIGKKKFDALAEDCKQEFTSAIQAMTKIKEDLLYAVEQDTEAFNEVMAAFRMPKGTEAEKATRHERIQAATLLAIASPERIANAAQKGLDVMEVILKYGNANTLSDMGVAVLLFSSAIEGAILNVKINLPGLADRQLANDFLQQSELKLRKMTDMKAQLLKRIHQLLLSS